MPSLTETEAKSIRTAVQLVASGALIAAVHFAVGHGLPVAWDAPALAGAMWATATAHNGLEDKGLIGTWLRQPTLSASGTQRKAAQIAAAAKKAAAKHDALVAKYAPVLQPLVDTAVDAALAKVDTVVAKSPAFTAGPETPVSVPASAPAVNVTSTLA